MTAHGSPIIDVVAAVIERDGAFLLTRRAKEAHLGGLWEFPGGKREPGEALDASLAREVLEELGARADVGAEIMRVEHAYSDRSVRLHFFTCELRDEPRAMLGQEMRWVPRRELETLTFPEADRALIAHLVGS